MSHVHSASNKPAFGHSSRLLGPLGAFGKEDVEELEKVEARFQGFMDSALKPPRKRQLGLGVVGRILNR